MVELTPKQKAWHERQAIADKTVEHLPIFKGFVSDTGALMDALIYSPKWQGPRIVSKDGFPLDPEECDAFVCRDGLKRDEPGGVGVVFDGEKWCRFGSEEREVS